MIVQNGISKYCVDVCTTITVVCISEHLHLLVGGGGGGGGTHIYRWGWGRVWGRGRILWWSISWKRRLVFRRTAHKIYASCVTYSVGIWYARQVAYSVGIWYARCLTYSVGIQYARRVTYSVGKQYARRVTYTVAIRYARHVTYIVGIPYVRCVTYSVGIGIDTNIEVIVVSLTTWEAHHSPRAKPEGCGELPRSLMWQQWPKLRYQFLFYHDETKLIMNKQILSI